MNTEDKLLQKKNVVGVAEGEKWSNGKNTHKPALLVFVEKKVPIEDLDPEDIIEKEIDGQITDVVGKSGGFNAMRGRRVRFRRPGTRVRRRPRVNVRKNPTPISNKKRAPRYNTRMRIRPVVGGISVGNPRITAGTLGGIFRDKDNQVVMLSNQHVLAGSNSAQSGEAIIQQGRYDGGKVASHRVGRLKDYIPLKNGINQDSAIAVVESQYSNMINYAGVVKGFRQPKVGLKVKKSGRTTKITSGRIIAVNGTFTVNYGPNEKYTFKNCVVSTFMSQGGDSGSILMDAKNRACGLLFAGSNTMTLYNNINHVVESYGLKLL